MITVDDHRLMLVDDVQVSKCHRRHDRHHFHRHHHLNEVMFRYLVDVNEVDVHWDDDGDDDDCRVSNVHSKMWKKDEYNHRLMICEAEDDDEYSSMKTIRMKMMKQDCCFGWSMSVVRVMQMMNAMTMNDHVSKFVVHHSDRFVVAVEENNLMPDDMYRSKEDV